MQDKKLIHENLLASSLEELSANTWQLIQAGVTSHKSSFHFGTLCTFDEQYPQARSVIIRAVDEVKKMIQCNTDIRSPKVTQLKQNPNISWLFYDEAIKLQIRCYGKGQVLHNNSLTNKVWNEIRLESQLHYSTQASPGSLLSEPEFIEMNDKNIHKSVIEFSKNNFAIVQTYISQMDIMVLHHKGNRRCWVDYEKNVISWKQV
jgi:pyridoxamine 5'-phosphate oxidase